MLTHHSLLLAALALTTLTPSTTAAPTQDGASPAPLPSDSLPVLSPPTAQLTKRAPLTASLNVSVGAKYLCLGDGLGYGLVPASCQDIILNSLLNGLDATPKQWGLRDLPSVSFDFPLPQRFVSRDGACIIDTNLGMWDRQSTLSQRNFVRGVNTLINTCVVNNRRPQAGVGRMLGGDNKMEITLLKSEPTARCYGDANVPGIFKSCVSLMNEMSTYNRYQRFGAGTGVDVALPYTLKSTDRKCYITVKTDGPVDKVAWQEIWEAVTSTTYMCAAQGKKGIQDRLGTGKHISVEMGAVNPFDTATS